MKKINSLLLSLLLLAGIVACNNDLDKVFDSQTLVEFNEAILRTNATGKTYSVTSLPNSITAGTTTTAQLNLVGRKRSSDLTVRVFVDPANTTAAATSYTLANGGNVVIKADSSFGILRMSIGRATSATAATGNIVLVIDSTSADFKPSQNYKRLGFSFRQ
jgi:ABC-type Fe3+-hydroxamate transport system substrate-binding protein